jgi:hypothetical protein
LVQRPLACVSKRRMADVVNQSKRLCKIFVQAKRRSCGPSDLRYLNRVRKTAAKVIRRAAGKNLRLSRKTPEGASLHNTLSVTLEGRTRGAERCRVDASQKKIVRISCDRAPMEIGCHSQI